MIINWWSEYQNDIIWADRNIGTYSIGIADDMCICESTDVLNERLHLISSESTVETESHRISVLKRSDKGFTSLTGQSTTTLIDNGTRDENGNLWASEKKPDVLAINGHFEW